MLSCCYSNNKCYVALSLLMDLLLVLGHYPKALLTVTIQQALIGCEFFFKRSIQPGKNSNVCNPYSSFLNFILIVFGFGMLLL